MALPRGTVTFLFTDIEGSTRLWERDRHAMRAAVDRHIALLDAAIHTHGGVHFKTVGDAVQAVFPTAPAALAAALDAQRALQGEAWGSSGPLHVRMALHAGEAEPDERGDYLAVPLNRLARLMAAGSGGQILLTQTVQQLSRGALPPGASLRDLGEHRLRDLLEPERVFQLVHPALPDTFPPLKTLERRAHNLPHQPTSFLGRQRELNEVVALLRRADVQLLTLTGPGGTGKTRLALEAAADLLGDFADGVCFVALAPLTDPALVPSAMAQALGVREEGSQPLTERLREFLAPKHLLLLIDNVEHLVDAASIIGDVLGAAPGLKVLATSRTPLRLRAEHEYPVPPLGLPRRGPMTSLDQLTGSEAVRLFVERAQAVKPSFAVDPDSASAIAEICWRLDGLPLAIELAAARMRLLSPQALLARLQHQLPLLTGGPRDAPARQQTLRQTIAWSHELLSAEEQILFRRLGVFAGGATLVAIEAVASPAGELDVFGILEQLVAHSLVRQAGGEQGEPRFQMLETIREFSLERLAEAGEESVTRGTHAEYILHFAERAAPILLQTLDPVLLAQVVAEADNARTALTWFDRAGETERGLQLAVSLGWVWYVRGFLNEGRVWLERARVADSAIAPIVRAWALAWASALAHRQDDNDVAAELASASVALFRDHGTDPFGLAAALLVLGVAEGRRGRSEQAVAHFEEALTRFRALDAKFMIGLVLAELGIIARGRGEAAESFLHEALAMQRQIANKWGAARLFSLLGELACVHGDLGGALARFREGIRLASDHGDLFHVADGLAGIGIVAAARGEPERAARLFGGVDALREVAGPVTIPPLQVRHERAIDAVRTTLGEEAFAAAWAAGRERSLPDLVAEVLAETADAAGSPVTADRDVADTFVER